MAFVAAGGIAGNNGGHALPLQTASACGVYVRDAWTQRPAKRWALIGALSCCKRDSSVASRIMSIYALVSVSSLRACAAIGYRRDVNALKIVRARVAWAWYRFDIFSPVTRICCAHVVACARS